MPIQDMTESSKACAFNTIMANVKNNKLSDKEFRDFILNTWAIETLNQKCLAEKI